MLDREKYAVTISVNLFGFSFMKPFIVGWLGISVGGVCGIFQSMVFAFGCVVSL